MKTIAMLAWVVLCSVSSAAEPVPRKVLLFDLWKLDSWENLELRQGEPDWVEECDYRDPSFPNRGVYFPSVWRDQASGTFRLIHSVRWSPFTMVLASSEDGIHWKPLPAQDVSPSGGKLAPNHLLTLPSGSGGGIYHDPKSSDGYAFRIFGRQRGEPAVERALADPKHRWHEIARQEGAKPYIDEGVTLVSKDGVDWEVKFGGHWNWQDEDWFPEPPVFTFWNERAGRHVMVARPGLGRSTPVLTELCGFAAMD